MMAKSRRLHNTEAPNPASSSHESCSVTRLGLSYTPQLELGTEGSELLSFLANISFSNAFSNADGYVRSRLNAGELKPHYRNQIRSPTIAGELKTTAWHARGQGFESPYLHQVLVASHLVASPKVLLIIATKTIQSGAAITTSAVSASSGVQTSLKRVAQTEPPSPEPFRDRSSLFLRQD
jgi:hypothetical protein